MNTNGIIRRVDNLGRVVIPREYRKLHKISLGDPMEISCNANGEIVLRKIDMTLTLEELSMPAIKLLHEEFGALILISNLEGFVFGCGENKGAYIGSPIPGDIKQSLLNRKGHSSPEPAEKRENGQAAKKTLLAEPIIGESDVFGAIYAVGEDITPVKHAAILKITASILGSSLQKY